jgi:cytochrome c551
MGVRSTRVLTVALCAAVAATLAACGGDDDESTTASTQTHTQTTKAQANGTGQTAAAGKQLFAEKCGHCHTLADAGTNADIGPNLDHHLGDEGMAREDRVKHVLEAIEEGPEEMPSKLVRGADARKVADYVASVAGK